VLMDLVVGCKVSLTVYKFFRTLFLSNTEK
jgi:hypothetical protein